MEFIKKLPTTEEIINQISLDDKLKQIKKEKDQEIRKIIEGKDDRFLLIIGPCSADSEDSVCDYIERLAKVQEEVKDSIFIIPRIYTNKPRTTGEGYKGIMLQPNPEEKPNIVEGIKAMRKMHLRAFKSTYMVAADEMLYPENYTYLSDLLGYVAIGARSVENQQHRLTVSGIDIPVGMKNPTSGDLQVMFNSIHAAQLGHEFIYNGWEVKTKGNDLTHAILRGAVDLYGRNVPNYHYEDLITTVAEYMKRKFANPSIIVDTNHANSMKLYKEQPRIAKEVLHSRRHNKDIKSILKGLMIESYLEEGNQKIGENIYGKSITDPCIGWNQTQRLIYYIAENL
jgi:3-deoxy-7-phosphoheptulonate synthase